jgi:hypothetical protein
MMAVDGRNDATSVINARNVERRKVTSRPWPFRKPGLGVVFLGRFGRKVGKRQGKESGTTRRQRARRRDINLEKENGRIGGIEGS